MPATSSDDQALGLQEADRRLHGGAPDAELLRHLAVGGQRLTGAHETQPDAAPNLLRDMLVRAARTHPIHRPDQIGAVGGKAGERPVGGACGHARHPTQRSGSTPPRAPGRRRTSRLTQLASRNHGGVAVSERREERGVHGRRVDVHATERQ